MEIKDFANKIALMYDLKLNENENFKNKVLNGLKTNKERYGKYYCPCVLVLNDDKNILCPCKYAFNEIKKYGHCYCGLFLDKNTTKVKHFKRE